MSHTERSEPDPNLGPCAWCGDPSVTEVIVVKGSKNRKTSPVCASHAEDFEKRGMSTVRSELEAKLERERKQSAWRAQRTWR